MKAGPLTQCNPDYRSDCLNGETDGYLIYVNIWIATRRMLASGPGRDPGAIRPLATTEGSLIEPLETTGVLITSFSTALVIASGTLYILLFSLSHLRKKPGMLILAYACFAVLLANVLALATLLYLDSYQLAQVLVVLLAYLLLPHAVRRLVARTAGGKPVSRSSCCTLFPTE
jgi:hypothetical protein